MLKVPSGEEDEVSSLSFTCLTLEVVEVVVGFVVTDSGSFF
jgi:hypothetical protein